MNHTDSNDLNSVIRCIKNKIKKDVNIINNRPTDGFSANFLNRIAEIYELYGHELAETELQHCTTKNRTEGLSVMQLLKIFSECGLTDTRIGGMLIKTLETTISQAEG